MKRYIRNPLFLFYLLVMYVVAQFSWWLYLIASLYSQIYSDPVLLEKKTMMLVGEGTVFVIILFGGVFMIKRAYRKEHELTKLQENFLLSISHELKTPIASVQLYLQTLQKRDLDDQKRDQIYASGLTEIKRLESLVNNLLITRSIENRNYFLSKTKLELDKLVMDFIQSIQTSLLKNHTIKIETEPISIVADKEALISIISNLIQNAVKYSPANTEITVRVKKSGSNAVIEISDQGIGISDQNKDKVFLRFFRDENEMTRKSKGTGLGLFICKFLVQLHKGQISLKDNTPNGLTIQIALPLE
ncbi:MAG: HAMP domain-containing histidine kinase [Crocinitomicaceae bacterium]|nr:HAMP domain-containing histidine kinase [Crocinitomicaceae bacterium]